MKNLKTFKEDASLAAASRILSQTSQSDSAVKNLNRNVLPDLMKSVSNPNVTSSRALPNLARPRSFDATPDRQSSLTRSHFNSNIGNKLGTRIDTTDNNKLQIK